MKLGEPGAECTRSSVLAVRSIVPTKPAGYPPLVLVHGAANSAGVWTFWQDMLAERGCASHAVDLRGHGVSPSLDLSRTTMADYASDVATVMDERRSDVAPVLVGWSMGGLVAMLAAASAPARVRAVVGLAPSTPTTTVDPSLPLRSGEFDAAEYGITTRNPDDQPAMPDLDREERAVALSSLCQESRYARDERARGVVIDSLPCPLLVVTGTADTQWPHSRYDSLHLKAEHISVDGASHWGLVLNRRALRGLVPRVVDWIGRLISDRR